MSLARISSVAMSLALTAAFAGCLDEAPEDEVATIVAPMRGFIAPGPVAGVVRVTVAGQADTHTGIMIGPGLVLTSSRWVGWTGTASSVTATANVGSASAESRSGIYLNGSSYFPAIVAQSQEFSAANVRIYPFDTRANVSLVNVNLRCYEYANDNLLYAQMRVAGANADGTLSLVMNPGPQTAEDLDAGAPCFDTATWTVVGMVTGADANGQIRVLRYNALQPWVDGLRNLAATRMDGSSSRLSLYTVGPGGQRMCLDIPWGSHYEHELLNVYPCHQGPAQRFWLDYRVDTRPRLVSDASGQCVDVPDASTVSGRDLQQVTCHDRTNQRFELSFWPGATGGWKLRPVQALAQNLCLSVEGGPRATAGVTEQRTCTGAADQQWYPLAVR